MNKGEITYEPVKGGIHAGGQHAQKNATGIRATHKATGKSASIKDVLEKGRFDLVAPSGELVR